MDRVRMAKKRSHEEIENIDDVDGPMCSTSIHSAVVRLLPVKKGWKAMFFDGVLADETSQILFLPAHVFQKLFADFVSLFRH